SDEQLRDIGLERKDVE
ncbi:DUF1127 domain-containing protein, partial [Salmonella enterica subsp. enterica serovar Typhimurium]|nr:DUF1127 domain-containing protein [Salmonella enterica subsp. enterica serovar Typhimurium]